METIKTKPSRWRIFGTGLAGFFLAALAGILAGYLFFRLGIYGWLIQLVPEGQPLIRLVVSIFLSFLGIGLAGAVSGFLSGVTLHRLDPQGSRRRYTLGGAFAYGITYALLLIPLLLLISLLAKYNQGSSKDPSSFIALFTLIGLIFGLLSGLILALITLKLRYSWRPLLFSVLGGAIGGMFLGLVTWRHDIFLALPTRQLQLIVFFLYFGLALAGLTGGLLALAYNWVRRKRDERADHKVEPRKAQDYVVIGAGLLFLLLVINGTNTFVDFITIHTGSTTTSLESQTQGVAWSSPATLGEDVVPSAGSTPDLAADPAGRLAAVWDFDQEGSVQIAYAFQTAKDSSGTAAWSPPVNASNSTTTARHPQIAIGTDGRVHIVWSEEISPNEWEIRYSNCYGDQCNPPISFPTARAESCQSAAGQEDWPAIAVAPNGSLGVAWNAGGLLAYTVIRAGEIPSASVVSCLTPDQGADPNLQPRLAAGAGDQFSLVYGTGNAEASGPIHLLEISPDGPGADTEVGQGRFPEIALTPDRQIHLAWCTAESYLNYSLYPATDAPVEMIQSPACINRPTLLQDSQGQMHLVWYSDQVANVYGNQQPGNFLYESIRMNDAWTEPAILSTLSQPAEPAVTSLPAGGFAALWQDAHERTPTLFLSEQPLYQCDAEQLNANEKAILGVVEGGQFHPAGYQSPFCENQFKSYFYMPEPDPAFSNLPVTPNGGFDLLRRYIQDVHYELLISNMQWDADQDEASPGFQIVEGIADLYRNIRANPSAYPRGLTVRILLGNYPNITTWQYGDQIWNVIEDLRAAGIDEMEDPEIGWKLEVANYKGSYPHSHTKFIVVDGKQLMSAGFNVSWLHYPDTHPSGKGDSLTDLGIAIEGPVGQPAQAVFDDQWTDSNQLYCPDLTRDARTDSWKRSCEWRTGTVSHVPEVLKYQLMEEGTSAFALFRTDVYKEADRSYEAALASAEETIDAIHVNFSADFICILNVISPDVCAYDEHALSWMKALTQAVEENQVKVRFIVENANMNGLENRVGIQMLYDELDSLGLRDLVEVRFFNGRVHMKTALIDQQLLFVGSQNFHYSSFAPGGLHEFVAATDSQAAIEEYERMFSFYWEQAVPSDEALWATTGE